MIRTGPVLLAPSTPRHRRDMTREPSVYSEYISQAACEGINWSTLNCTGRCPRHWPIGYSAHGRHRSDRKD